VLLVAKPAGPTSHDIVDIVRRALGTRRIGHTGTLDPFAAGLLVMLVGRATRLAPFAAAWQKSYDGRIRLGAVTDTDDATGRVLHEQPVGVDRAELERALDGFRGASRQRREAQACRSSRAAVNRDRARAAVRQQVAFAVGPAMRQGPDHRCKRFDVARLATDDSSNAAHGADARP